MCSCCCFDSTGPLQTKTNILNCNIIPKLNSYRETAADRMCPMTEGASFSPTLGYCPRHGDLGSDRYTSLHYHPQHVSLCEACVSARPQVAVAWSVGDPQFYVVVLSGGPSRGPNPCSAEEVRQSSAKLVSRSDLRSPWLNR